VSALRTCRAWLSPAICGGGNRATPADDRSNRRQKPPLCAFDLDFMLSVVSIVPARHADLGAEQALTGHFSRLQRRPYAPQTLAAAIAD
jgi:hypothetical protein